MKSNREKFVATVNWEIFPDAISLQAHAAQLVLESAQAAIRVRSDFHLVLAGGRTPQAVYARLAQAQAQWENWQIYFGDERCLPRGDAQRNDSLARAAWLDRVTVPASHIHSIPAEQGPVLAAQQYAETLAGIAEFDLVLLGLGEDGHTASLFPGHNLGEAQGSPTVLPVTAAPKPPAERVSLGIARLNQARQILFLVTGKEKQPAVAAWRRGADIPARYIANAQTHVLLDQAAAGEPERTPSSR